MTRVRWWILGLLFFGTTLNYLDRVVFSFLAPEIRREFHFTPQEYGYMTGAFDIAYMLGFLWAGRLIDRIGTRRGYALTVAAWSIAAALHCTARTALPKYSFHAGAPGFTTVASLVTLTLASLFFWRAMLGLAESGNFPAAIKSVTEWFPAKDRALATGIFNSGSNVAAMAGPLLLAVIYARFGWRACFLVTAAMGGLWLVAWLASYQLPEQHARVNRAELEYIRDNVPAKENGTDIRGRDLLKLRETWGFVFGKFLTTPVWMLLLWWLPVYLSDVYKLTPQKRAWALSVVYLAADVGSVMGGWLSGFLMQRGWTPGQSRKIAMTVCAVCMPVGAGAVLAPNAVLAVALISIAAGAHQGWSANLFTTVSDVFPKQAVGSVVSIGSFAAALGSFLFASILSGQVIAQFGYKPVFLAIGWFHPVALALVFWLMCDLQSINLGSRFPGRVRAGISIRG
jgi:ACS family hexuronate transporter-like MFS transporter